MSNHDLAIVILAAGKGTRLKSSLAKVLHRAGGRTLIEHVVRACAPLGAKQTVVVVGHQAEQVTPVVEPFGAETVLQQPQHGTGHAVQIARRALGRAKLAVVLPGDAPPVRTETLKALIAAHRAGDAAATILTAVLADPSGYGRILRKSETAVAAIVEESQLTPDQRELNEINSAIYCFTLDKLWPALAHVKPNNKHRELYLTDTISTMTAKNETVLAEVAPDAREVLGCNTRADLAEVDRVFRERKRAALMDAGVTIQLPETVLIDPEVTAGEDTVIEAGVQLLGKTKIGARCTIREGTKAMHLTYLGDTKIGAKSNIGAGTITCNYDGFHKFPTSIGNKVFIGSDSALVAPVRIGDGAYVAAGSTITDNVPADALAIARGRQVNKAGWASKKRRELAAAENPKKTKRVRKKTKLRKRAKKRK